MRSRAAEWTPRLGCLKGIVQLLILALVGALSTEGMLDLFFEKYGKHWRPRFPLDSLPAVTRALLDHGANPNAEDRRGDTPLHVIARATDNLRHTLPMGKRGVAEVEDALARTARLLIDHGAVAPADKGGQSPLDVYDDLNNGRPGPVRDVLSTQAGRWRPRE